MRIFRARKGFFVFLLLLLTTVSNIAAQDKTKPKPKTGPKATPVSEDAPTPSPTPTPAPTPTYQSALAALKFREIGPATMGGRIDDIEVVPSDPRIIYVATAAGGILKSVNGGTSWTTLFDKETVPSVGDIAITPSNPSIIWAGSGEANNRQSSSWGNGIYKSMDAGKTWKLMGLSATHHIARVVVHPTNPDIVYVAATGDLWNASPDRGRICNSCPAGKAMLSPVGINARPPGAITTASRTAASRSSPAAPAVA